MKVHETFVQIARPSGHGDMGTIEEGFYIIDGGEVILTDPKGAPLASGRIGVGYVAKLGNENHVDVARRLIWRRYRATKGGADFNRPLRYPDAGWP